MVVQISSTFNIKDRGQNNLSKKAIPLLFALKSLYVNKNKKGCGQRVGHSLVVNSQDLLQVLTFFH